MANPDRSDEPRPPGQLVRRILVGVDFSRPSEHALEMAIALARELHASLHLVHVYQVPSYAFPETLVPAPPNVLDELIAEDRERLRKLADRARAAAIPVTTEQVAGSPLVELVQKAGEGFDLVVVGTHGRSGLKHALLGSVAERVVRRSSVPVLSVRTPDREETRGEAPREQAPPP